MDVPRDDYNRRSRSVQFATESVRLFHSVSRAGFWGHSRIVSAGHSFPMQDAPRILSAMLRVLVATGAGVPANAQVAGSDSNALVGAAAVQALNGAKANGGR